eukprot:3304382-Rhodomonas_salina.1
MYDPTKPHASQRVTCKGTVTWRLVCGFEVQASGLGSGWERADFNKAASKNDIARYYHGSALQERQRQGGRKDVHEPDHPRRTKRRRRC